MQKLKDKSNRLAKMFYKMQEFDYVIEYKKGSENVIADFLSRIPARDIEVASITMIKSIIEWDAEQRKDSKLEPVLQLVEDRNNSKNDWCLQVEDKRWFKMRKWLITIHGVLKKIDFGGELLIVAPEHLREKIFYVYHDLSNHKGSYNKIKEHFFWLSMQDDVERWSKSCDTCQKTKFVNKHPRAPLNSIVVTRPFQLMGFDQIGPLPVSDSGNRYINLACDYFSKYGEAEAMKENTAETCAKFAYENVICRFGMFDAFITDQGPQFESRLFKELFRMCGVKKMR